MVLAAASLASGQQDTSQRSSIRGPPPSRPQDASDGVRSWGNSHDAPGGIQTGQGYWSSGQPQQPGYGGYGTSPRPQSRDSDGCRSATSTQTLRCNGSSCAPVYHGGCDPSSEFARSSIQSRCEMPDARLAGSAAICYYDDVCCPRADMVVAGPGLREAAAPPAGGAGSRLGDEWFLGADGGGGVDSTYQNYLDEKYGGDDGAGAGAPQGENWWGESWQGGDDPAAAKKSSGDAADEGGGGHGAGIGFAICISALVAFQAFVYRKSRRGSGGGAEVSVPKVPVEVTRALGGLDDETTVVSSKKDRKPKNSGKKKKKEPAAAEKEGDNNEKEKTIYDSSDSDDVKDENGSLFSYV